MINQLDEASDPWVMSDSGKLMRDAWVFGLLPEGQGVAEQNAMLLQMLAHDVRASWQQHGNCVNCLPRELRNRYTGIHAEAIRRAKMNGWEPEAGD